VFERFNNECQRTMLSTGSLDQLTVTVNSGLVLTVHALEAVTACAANARDPSGRSPVAAGEVGAAPEHEARRAVRTLLSTTLVARNISLLAFGGRVKDSGGTGSAVITLLQLYAQAGAQT
jgi:hypothetical protein